MEIKNWGTALAEHLRKSAKKNDDKCELQRYCQLKYASSSIVSVSESYTAVFAHFNFS